MNKEKLELRKQELIQQRDQLMAHINQVIGALAQIEVLISEETETTAEVVK